MYGRCFYARDRLVGLRLGDRHVGERELEETLLLHGGTQLQSGAGGGRHLGPPSRVGESRTTGVCSGAPVPAMCLQSRLTALYCSVFLFITPAGRGCGPCKGHAAVVSGAGGAPRSARSRPRRTRRRTAGPRRGSGASPRRASTRRRRRG